MEDERVLEIVKSSGNIGRTVTEVTAMSRLPRSVVRILLERLYDDDRITFRMVGMSRVYSV